MKVISVNVGEKRTVLWKNQSVETGIFKSPVDRISLGKTDVDRDNVVDRRVHGGVDKACYLFGADKYDYWKSMYGHLSWNWGMFGENITVSELDESAVYIGSTYKLGTAIVEVSQPRQPCFKLGIRFGTQQILREFIQHGHPGAYVRVLQPGKVQPGDRMELRTPGSHISIKDVFLLLYGLHSTPELVHEATRIPSLAESARRDLLKCP